MKYKLVLVIPVFILLTGLCYLPSKDEIKEKQIIQSMIKAIRQTKTLKFNLVAHERMEKNRPHELRSKVKLQLKPRKLYIYMEKEGQELLWVEGKNNGHAVINPNGFPYINLNLEPNGNLMRKDQHHSIHELGFEYLADLLERTIKTNETEFYKYTAIAGSVAWNGIDCHNLVISYPKFAFVEYLTKEGDDLIKLARDKGISELMIKMKNPVIKEWGKLPVGIKILIPNMYAKQIYLFIDKKTSYPVFQKIVDDEGMFEQYEYFGLEINPTILPEEFTTEYPGYGF